MIKKYFLTNSLFRQELIDRREKRELIIHWLYILVFFELC